MENNSNASGIMSDGNRDSTQSNEVQQYDSGGRKPYENRRGKPTKTQYPARFIGALVDIPGHVFQVNGEQRKKGQFRDMFDMLRVYTSKNCQKDMEGLVCLFGDSIKVPEVNDPVEAPPKPGTPSLTKIQEKI